MSKPSVQEQEQLACRMEQNYINGFKLLSGINGAEFSENEALAEFFSGYQVSWMNGVFRIDGACKDLDEIINRTLNRYAGKCPMIWRVGALTNRSELVAELLLSKGLQFGGSEPGMVLDATKLQFSESLPDITVRNIDDVRHIPDWLEQFAAVFDLPEDAKSHFGMYMQSQVGNAQNEAWFVGCIEDVPICTSYYLIDSGVTMIYNVGTLPEYRNKGCARRVVEATISHAMTKSKNPITLYASDMGRPLYEKMGFVETYRFNEYVLN